MRYFKNTSWLFFEKILRMIVGLFVGIWLARYLGPEDFGIFSYAQSFVGLFIAVSALGLDAVIVREFIKNENRRDSLLGTAFSLKLIGAILLMLILTIAVNFTSNDTHINSLIYIIASATIFQSFNVIDFYFQSKVMSKFVVYANMVSLFLSSLIKIVLILNNAPLVAFAWVVLFDSFVLSIGFLYFYLHKNLSIKTWKFDKKLVKSLLQDSLFYMFTAIVISMYMQIDQIMIKEMLGVESVGYYAVAAKLSELWYFLPIILSKSLYPAIENAKKQSETLYYNRLERLFILCNLIAIAIIVPTVFLSDTIVTFLYGDAFALAGTVLSIHIFSLLFAFQRVPSESWVISENLKYFEIVKTLLGLIINVVLNIFLIEQYGIIGAAIATVISLLVAGYLSYAIHKKGIIIFKMMTRTSIFIKLKIN